MVLQYTALKSKMVYSYEYRNLWRWIPIQNTGLAEFKILSLVPVINLVPERQGEEYLGRFQVKKSA